MSRVVPIAASLAVLAASGCSEPICRPELVAEAGRCIVERDDRNNDPIPVVEKQCEPACSATSHEVCDDDPDSPTCICAPGYAGNPCVWQGVLVDPGFQDQQSWTLTRGATVFPDRRGSVDDGVGFLEPSVACNAGSLSQLVQMPSYEVAEPLVAEVTYRAEGTWGLSIAFNRVWTQLGPTLDGEWRTERVCLGETAYSELMLIQLGAREQHFTCFGEPVGSIEVDRLDFLTAAPGECPAPGEVLNGTADSDLGGWQFAVEGEAAAGFAEGRGRAGSSGVRVARGTFGQAVAWTRFSVPTSESLESPALRFWWQGDDDFLFKFQTGRFQNAGSSGHIPLDDVRGNGSEVSSVYCLPPWTHGSVLDLIVTPLPDSSRPAESSEIVVDDVEIVSDVRCGTSPDVLDPGFEAAPARIMGATHFNKSSTITLVNDPTLARSGEGVLEISYINEDAIARWETWVLVPEPDGGAGPTAVFYSKVPIPESPSEPQKLIQSVKGRAAVEPASLVADGEWRKNVVCLPPEWSRRWFRLQLRLGQVPAIGNAVVSPSTRIFIDDLEVKPDTDCPAE